MIQEHARPVTRPTLSVIAPAYNEESVVQVFYERVVAVLEGIDAASFEIILVDDGSSDRTPEVITQLAAQDQRLKAVLLSRNFGHQAAISAGIDYANGDAVVIIDSDLQDPPEVIPELVEAWRQGGEVVYARRRSRRGENSFKLITATLFYRLMEILTPVQIPRDTGDFRLLDKRVVATLRSMREHHRFMRGLSSWVGFRQVSVLYDRHERFAGTTKYPLAKMVAFSTDAVTSFSNVPLRAATSAGFFMAGVSLLGIVGAAIARLKGGAIRGQGTTVTAVLFLGGIQLICLGILGEYLGRVYDEVRNRPLYVVRKTLGLRPPGS